jgi:hypothetical protein
VTDAAGLWQSQGAHGGQGPGIAAVVATCWVASGDGKGIAVQFVFATSWLHCSLALYRGSPVLVCLCCGKPPVQLILQGHLVLPVSHSLPGLRVASFPVVCCCARLLLQACLRSHARGAVVVAPPAASEVLCWYVGWHGWVTLPNSSAVSASAAHLMICSGYLVLSDWQHACAACQARPAVCWECLLALFWGCMRVWAFCPCNVAGAWCFLLLSASLAALGAPAWHWSCVGWWWLRLRCWLLPIGHPGGFVAGCSPVDSGICLHLRGSSGWCSDGCPNMQVLLPFASVSCCTLASWFGRKGFCVGDGMLADFTVQARLL